jgi:hypothetical protein
MIEPDHDDYFVSRAEAELCGEEELRDVRDFFPEE